jgi:hypothetical protein
MRRSREIARFPRKWDVGWAVYFRPSDDPPGGRPRGQHHHPQVERGGPTRPRPEEYIPSLEARGDPFEGVVFVEDGGG